MLALVEALLALVTLVGLVWEFLSPAGKDKVKSFLGNFWTSSVELAVPVLTAVEGELQPIVKAFIAAFNSAGPPIAQDVQAAIAPVARAAFSTAEAGLTSAGESSPDNAVARAAQAFADAFGFGLSSAAVTAAFEAAFPEKLNVLNGAGPMLAQLAGFEEIAKAVLTPLYDAAFGKALEYHYRSIFKPELPDEADAVRWHSRRLLTEDQLRNVFKYSGLKDEYEAPYIASAYRPAQPRAIVNAYSDLPFPRDQVQSMLEFAGFRPEDVALMMDAFESNSTRTVRQQYASAVITAAERGTLTDAEVDSALTDLNFSDDAKHWVRLTIATRKLEQLAEIYRKSISEAYKFGQLTDADYVPALEAIGIAEADARAHYAVDSIAKRGREAVAEARVEERLANQTRRAATQAAIAQFAHGDIDSIALAGELLAAGQPAVVVPFVVELEQLRNQAKLRNVYGKLVRSSDGTLLRERIGALKEQVVKKLVDPTAAFELVIALGVPRQNAIALVTTWAAEIKATFTAPA